MFNIERRARKPSLLACCGGVLAAAAVALSAYASHGIADPAAQANVSTAALYAFGHGAVLAALGAQQQNTIGRVSLYALLVGVLLFSGSLVGGALLHWSTRLAPVGGSTLILAWLVYGLNCLRR